MPTTRPKLQAGCAWKRIVKTPDQLTGACLKAVSRPIKSYPALQANYAATFFYEGVAWYAQQSTGAGWSPLYRFRNLLNGTYLFSAYEAEKNAIVANYSAVFKLEGVAYYVRQDATPPNNDFSFIPNGSGDYYDRTECVKDEATGLIWEGKPTRGLRAYNTPYSNYDSLTEPQKWIGRFPILLVTQAEIDAAVDAANTTFSLFHDALV